MKKTCNFCGRGEKEVGLLITGLNGFICEDCSLRAYEILQESGILHPKKKDDGGKFQLKKVPKPMTEVVSQTLCTTGTTLLPK